MLTIREYKKVESLEEAYTLNQKKSNRVIGGMIWLKMETLNVGTAIDLSGLGLDTIEETETEFRIGAMASLRALELHEGLAAYTNGAMRESVRHIVGVQLRNLATVGGSLYSRCSSVRMRVRQRSGWPSAVLMCWWSIRRARVWTRLHATRFLKCSRLRSCTFRATRQRLRAMWQSCAAQATHSRRHRRSICSRELFMLRRYAS